MTAVPARKTKTRANRPGALQQLHEPIWGNLLGHAAFTAMALRLPTTAEERKLRRYALRAGYVIERGCGVMLRGRREYARHVRVLLT